MGLPSTAGWRTRCTDSSKRWRVTAPSRTPWGSLTVPRSIWSVWRRSAGSKRSAGRSPLRRLRDRIAGRADLVEVDRSVARRSGVLVVRVDDPFERLPHRSGLLDADVPAEVVADAPQVHGNGPPVRDLPGRSDARVGAAAVGRTVQPLYQPRFLQAIDGP